MFNKVLAPFAGTIDEVLVAESGAIVQQGPAAVQGHARREARRGGPGRARAPRPRSNTDAYLKRLG